MHWHLLKDTNRSSRFRSEHDSKSPSSSARLPAISIPSANPSVRTAELARFLCRGVKTLLLLKYTSADRLHWFVFTARAGLPQEHRHSFLFAVLGMLDALWLFQWVKFVATKFRLFESYHFVCRWYLVTWAGLWLLEDSDPPGGGSQRGPIWEWGWQQLVDGTTKKGACKRGNVQPAQFWSTYRHV